MREILFKGKTLNEYKDIESTWVFGALIQNIGYTIDCPKMEIEEKCYIRDVYDSSNIQGVDPKTVSQYIWTIDINEREIYEGDILALTKYSDKRNTTEYSFVEWSIQHFCFIVTNYKTHRKETDKFKKDVFLFCDIRNCLSEFEIIGNIHDDPNILKHVIERTM